MRVEEFSMLVDEHARAWRKAGISNSGVIFDPNNRYDLQEAREMSRKLTEAFRDAQTAQSGACKMSFEEDTTETHERRIVRCRSCNAKIIWFVTDAGKRMPVDADTVEADDFDLEIGRHISHFATCPQGNRWRKPR